MNKPKMIIFDYGHTLCYEDTFNNYKGIEAVMKYATADKSGLNLQELAEYSDKTFREFAALRGEQNAEFTDAVYERYLFESLQIELSIPYEEVGRVMWDNGGPAVPMPGIENVLDYLSKSGIRTAVFSNITYPRQLMRERLDRILPNNSFEFIIASSDYGIRKPDTRLFSIAIMKSGLDPSEIWFCGDNTVCDIYGANAAGLFPVWYLSDIACPYRSALLDKKPVCNCLSIKHWPELIEFLEKC